MGLGEMFARATQYVATDTVTGLSETFVVDGTYADWSSGDYCGAMGLPGAWRATVLLSDLLGQLPWHAYRQRGTAAVEMLSPNPPILEQPAPPDTRMTTLSSLALDLLWHGNAVAVIAQRDPAGWPTALVPVRADCVQVRWSTDDYGVAASPRRVYDIAGREFGSDDVIHVKGPCHPGALRGMSVLENHLSSTFRLADSQQRQAASVGTQGVPSGLLKSSDPNFDEPDAIALKASWLRNQEQRTIAVLNASTTFEPLAWDPSKTQLLDARKFSLHEVALIFGLDPSWLGVSGASMTYSNVTQEAINLVRYSLGGHLARMEQALSAHLPRGTWAKANLDALLRGTTQERYAAHAVALASGFMTYNEVRDLEDLPPYPDGYVPPVAPQPAGPSLTGDDRS